MNLCEPVSRWDMPTLTGEFTRCDVAHAANSAFGFAFIVSVVVIVLLAIIAFRGP